METAFGVVRGGGTVSRVGAPQYPDVPAEFDVFLRNITLTGDVAPALEVNYTSGLPSEFR